MSDKDLENIQNENTNSINNDISSNTSNVNDNTGNNENNNADSNTGCNANNNINSNTGSNTDNTNSNEDEYEKICYVCRRPESKAGKMIDMPGGICVCTDCLQKSFNSFQNLGMNVNISNEELEKLLSMPGVHMMTPEEIAALFANM